MMVRSLIPTLEDVLSEIEFLGAATRNVDYEGFLDDEVLQHAVERALEIIGEAASNVPDDARHRYPDVPWAKMVGMRNVLTHAYFRTDRSLVWEAVFDQALPLRSVIEAILASERAR